MSSFHTKKPWSFISRIAWVNFLKSSMTCCSTTLRALSSKDNVWATRWPSVDTRATILCRSQDRKEKDKAIVKRAADKIAERLASTKSRCEKQNRDPLIVSREIGRLLGQNTRASHLFKVDVLSKDKKFALIEWQRIKPATDWHELSNGCYLLRSNVTDWSDEELLSEIRLVDVVLPTETGKEIRNRCVARPTEHQRILLEKLNQQADEPQRQAILEAVETIVRKGGGK